MCNQGIPKQRNLVDESNVTHSVLKLMSAAENMVNRNQKIVVNKEKRLEDENIIKNRTTKEVTRNISRLLIRLIV